MGLTKTFGAYVMFILTILIISPVQQTKNQFSMNLFASAFHTFIFQYGKNISIFGVFNNQKEKKTL